MSKQLSFNDKLQLVRKSIKDGYALMGSKWKNLESELIALQTIFQKANCFNVMLAVK